MTTGDDTRIHTATLLESVADAVPGRTAFVQGDRRLTWAEFDDRAARLASVLLEAGLDVGSKVAIFLYNSPEYLVTWWGAQKVRCIPVNVNYRYLDDELAYLLDDADAEVVVYHRSLRDRVEAVAGRLPAVRRWLEVLDPGDDPAERPDSGYERALAAVEPAPRFERPLGDISIGYTGGTTGLPKGVMHRADGFALSVFAGVPPLLGLPTPTLDTLPEFVRAMWERDEPIRAIVPCPLMHGTGIGLGAVPAMVFGGTIVFPADHHFDPAGLWPLAAAERASTVTVVGDSMARPLAEALERHGADGLDSMQLVLSAGAVFSREVKDRFCQILPQVRVVDVFASTELGMGQSVHTIDRPAPTARFEIGPTVAVLDDDLRPVTPGSGDIGMLAVSGDLPLGYHKDPELTAKTFPVIDGVRWGLSGDYATVDADGAITLLGRGSRVINTAGEKVYAEEVESALVRHADIVDALVMGRPDERFGNRVAALVVLAPGAADDRPAWTMHVRDHLAAYKAPREYRLVDEIPRAPNGKIDRARAADLWTAD